MRLLILMVLLVGLGASSCEKYQLKQPAYLNFKWDFFAQEEGPLHPQISGGYFFLKKVSVHGSREEGPEVDIDQELPVMKTLFSANGSLGLTMDVPVGDYTQFEVSLKVSEEELPSMALTGSYDFGGGNVAPFRIEWGTGKDLNFHPANGFTLSKKKNYDATIGLDVQKLFSSTTVTDWATATQTLENGVYTIVISATNNSKIFGDVETNLEEALLLKID